ncbi:unnamed protein product [Phytophthora fragariaefolia]|uniref:Unnamed protein product n=1 Tax=Phytophthora fragariaefolia TaxID=1490495 RepID=A0A9W7DCC8_9STRA|nr:unnamed protein product [Phytophthora fragariaefolia]
MIGAMDYMPGRFAEDYPSGVGSGENTDGRKENGPTTSGTSNGAAQAADFRTDMPTHCSQKVICSSSTQVSICRKFPEILQITWQAESKKTIKAIEALIQTNQIATTSKLVLTRSSVAEDKWKHLQDIIVPENLSSSKEVKTHKGSIRSSLQRFQDSIVGQRFPLQQHSATSEAGVQHPVILKRRSIPRSTNPPRTQQ